MRKKNGFTLVEVLVAMSILTIGVVALMQTFPHAMRLSRRAAERTTVSSVAKTELGRVKAAGVGNLVGEGNWAVRGGLLQLSAVVALEELPFVLARFLGRHGDSL